MQSGYGKYNDKQLYEMLGDKKEIAEAAFGELYARYAQRIYAYCLRITGNSDDARDIFQETFLKFFHSVERIKKMDNVAGYLIKIARNQCLNFKRFRRDNVSIEDYNITVNDTSYEQKELLQLVARALDMLDFESREAFILRQYHGLSYNEIASITGASVSSMKSRVWRAKLKLKEILDPFLHDLPK